MKAQTLSKRMKCICILLQTLTPTRSTWLLKSRNATLPLPSALSVSELSLVDLKNAREQTSKHLGRLGSSHKYNVCVMSKDRDEYHQHVGS